MVLAVPGQRLGNTRRHPGIVTVRRDDGFPGKAGATIGLNLPHTRFGLPPAARHLVRRARLADAIETGVRECRLTLASAPAGYGKSSLLAGWARETDHPVAWLALDARDDDLERFFRYLLKTWERVQPDVADQPAGVMLSGHMPGVEPVLDAFLETAGARDEPIVFVLDDYQTLQDQAIHEAMTTLLDHAPSTLRVVISSRETPPLPIARWRARGELAELGPDDLRLRPEESEAFLNEQLHLDLPAGTIATLNEQTEGWFAGVQLAALTIKPGDPPPAAISGRSRFIADYIREDVLDHLPRETSEFLVRTCIVDRLCSSLADAIAGSDNGQELLERLERLNLFTTPLDDTREWFRYHRLFADVLRDELGRQHPDEIEQLHHRAAAWYLEHNMPEPAFDHAMATGDAGVVRQVLERFMQVVMFSGQIRTLQDWYARVPAAWVDIEPMIGLFRATVNIVTGQFDAGMNLLNHIEQRVGPAGSAPVIESRVTALRCIVACYTNDLDHAREYGAVALETLAPADESYRGGIHGALGDTYRRNGYWTEAHDHYRRALQHIDIPEGHIQAIHAYGALADLELRQGNLRAANDYWRKALDKVNDPTLWGVYPLPLIGWVYTRHGEILYEWNELDAAREAFDRGHERVLAGGDPRAIIASGLLGWRLGLARGDLDQATHLFERVRPVVAEAKFPDWSSEFERCQAEFWMAQGRLRTAASWCDEALTRDLDTSPDQEPVLLAIARVLIARGNTDAIERALHILEEQIDAAEREGRKGILVAAGSLRAMALWQRGDRPSALASVERAMRLAEQEGYTRTFTDLGLPMARLLQEARDRKVMAGYVEHLLSTFDTGTLAGLPAETPLPEPLSEREIAVLREIAAGLTNREVADRLYISPETVKKHTGSIYGKLGVRGRTEAIARARALDLLD